MADVFSKKNRSDVMSAIKGRGNRSTELAVRGLLKKLGITGWRTNLAAIKGKPDIAFSKIKLAVFIDGCFWHGCKTCARNLKPGTNSAFWRKKVADNIRRDKRVNRQLNRLGWSVLRIWEHSVDKNKIPVGIRLINAITTRRKRLH